MAPSKRTKILAACKEWTKSTSQREDLEELVMDGVLPNEAMVGWRLVIGEQFLDPRATEVVIFKDFYS